MQGMALKSAQREHGNVITPPYLGLKYIMSETNQQAITVTYCYKMIIQQRLAARFVAGEQYRFGLSVIR